MKLSKILEFQKSNIPDCFHCYYSYYNLRALYKFRSRNFPKCCIRFLLTLKPYSYKDDLNACLNQDIINTYIVTLKPKLFNHYKLFV